MIDVICILCFKNNYSSSMSRLKKNFSDQCFSIAVGRRLRFRDFQSEVNLIRIVTATNSCKACPGRLRL
jgi:hypothetical protein